jgi:hypothetical protein
MTRKLISKKELKSVYGIPYRFAHIARLEAVDKFSEEATEVAPGCLQVPRSSKLTP